MKLKFLLLFFALILAAPVAQASFPVQRTATVSVEAQSDENAEVLYSPAAAGQKSKGAALLLWVFLGALAAHRWYLGSPWYWNLLYMFTGGGFLIWAVIDLIDILSGDYPTKGGFKEKFF